MRHSTTDERSTRDLIDRYMGRRRDPDTVECRRFRFLVDMMVAQMIENKIAPDEIRDAAYLASIKFLQMHPIDTVYRRDDVLGGG